VNVLVLMSDQHSPKVLGCAGHPVVRTPNLDALTAAGTRFTAAYTNSPICVPARAAWATGRYVHETGCWDNATAYGGEPPGWGHALQAAGVRVESIGKLHYRDAVAPTGFDRQINPMHLAGGVGQVWGSVRDPLPRRRGAHLLVAWSGAGETDYTRYDRHSTELACEWLAERGSHPGEPWVLYVGLVAPHHPWIAPDEWFGLYDPASLPPAKLRPQDGHRRHPWVEAYARMLVGLDERNTDEERQRCTAAYYGLVSYLDDNVGRILDALDRAGLRDDTLVVYTTDHGETLGSRGLWGKTVLYEETAGIPLVVAGPGVASGREVRTPTTLVDGYPTILEATGVPELPGEPPRPGRSWLALAAEPDDPRRVAFSEYHAMGASSAAFLVRRDRYKLIHYVGFEPELFDLEADPEETTNLAGDRGAATVLAELDGLLRDIVDPEEVDRRAKADQAALVARFGGAEVAVELGTVAETPVPEEVTETFQ
jgi:choline-sulfatase